MTDAEAQVDLVVIGLGPGGEALATAAAKAGLSVLAVDKHLVGGECPYYGCIPSKMMVRAADTLAEAGRAGALAGDVSVTASWAPVARRVSEEATAGWDDTVAVRRLEDAGAEVLHGVARLAGPGRVEVELPGGGTRSVTAERGVVLNPGTRPAAPPVEGLTDTPYWTNREALRATELPGSLVVLGGGPIGCELAQVFARFGVRVTIVQHGDRLVPANEPEAAELLTDVLVGEGIRVLTSAEARSVSHADGTFTLTVATDTGEETLHADQLLVAAGRTPNLDDVGLETVGLDPEARTVETDERMRAGERLWAVGDITGCGPYTHVARYQAVAAVRDLLGEDGPWGEYHAVTRVTFTDPEVGGVGLTEAQARDAGLSVATGVASVAKSSRGWIHGGEPPADGVVKVVADTDRGILVGATTVAPYGGEVLGLLAAAVHARMPIETLRGMHFAYLTFHRVIQNALNQL